MDRFSRRVGITVNKCFYLTVFMVTAAAIRAGVGTKSPAILMILRSLIGMKVKSLDYQLIELVMRETTIVFQTGKSEKELIGNALANRYLRVISRQFM